MSLDANPGGKGASRSATKDSWRRTSCSATWRGIWSIHSRCFLHRKRWNAERIPSNRCPTRRSRLPELKNVSRNGGNLPRMHANPVKQGSKCMLFSVRDGLDIRDDSPGQYNLSNVSAVPAPGGLAGPGPPRNFKRNFLFYREKLRARRVFTLFACDVRYFQAR